MPVKAKSKSNDKYPNDGYLNGTQDVELTTIQINPDHDALNSFSIDGIKNGARTMISGVPGRYTWRDGEVVDKDGKVIMDTKAGKAIK